jgi:uncharacterized protein YjbI with pentapeptide repeats
MVSKGAQRTLLSIAITFLAIIAGIFVLGIINQQAVSEVWGTIEKTTQYTNVNTGKIVTKTYRTVWDLVDLLLIPLVIAVGGYFFNQAQQKREQEFAEAQNENQRRIGLDRDQEKALQNYLDKMGELLLEKKLNTTKDKVVLNLARSRTLTILRSLNNQYLDIDGRGRNRRKGSLARFLYEMNLITGKKPIISLYKANLEYAYMHGGEFVGVNFTNTYLKEADLRKSNLEKALLVNAYLPGARLNDANLKNVNLTGAKLQGANLTGAVLDGALLDNADMKGAIMPDGSIYA